MERVDDPVLYETAKRTLGIPVHKKHATVPSGYLQELQIHVNHIKDDTNFRVFPQPGYGYGVVQCLEKGCDNISLSLTKNKEQSIIDGIGSLTVFRIHATSPTHVAARQARILAIRMSTNNASKPGVRTNTQNQIVTVKQEFPVFTVTNGDVKFAPEMSHTGPLNKGTSDFSVFIVKTEDTPHFDLAAFQDSKLPPAVKQEESFDSASGNNPLPTIPLKRDFSSCETENIPSENISAVSSKKIKKESSLPFLSSSHTPLSELDSNVQPPLLLGKHVSSGLGLDNVGMEMKTHPFNMPIPTFPHDVLLYGDVKPLDDEGDYPNERSTRSDDLNKFIIQAGNAEFFDGNASVDKALERLGLVKLGESLPFMEVSLLPHQIIGVCWMLEHERGSQKGGILADEMGLGKTVQMIATMVQHRSDDPAIKSTLLCAPLALLEQWKLEIEMKTNNYLSCFIYHGSSKAKSLKELQKYDVVITTYGTLTTEWPDDPKIKQRKKNRDNDFIASEDEAEKVVRKRGLLLRMKWFRVVLDEAQLIRNKQTRVSNVVTELDTIYRWCLTGTPIINKLTDCYSQFRFLKLRPWNDWGNFRKHIVHYESRSPSLATKRLQAILNTCLLRRKKDTMLDGKRLIELPPKEIRLEPLTFTKEEREIYDVVEKRSQVIFNRYMRAGTVLKNYTHVFVLLLRLRQLCGHPALIQENADAFVRPEDEIVVKAEYQSEIHRATILCGEDFVEKIKEKRKEVMLQRMEAEKSSLDATIEAEDCPICFDVINTPVITLCGHSFCKECLELVMTQPAVVTEDAERRLASTERPCPTCRFPIEKEKVFERAAFEPISLEPDQVEAVDSDEEDGMPIDAEVMKKNNLSDDEEDSIEIVSQKSRHRNKAKRRSFADLDSGSDDYDDDDDDFIVDTEEEEDNEPRTRPHKRKNVILSDDEDELLPPKVVRRRTRKTKGVRRAFLPSTKLKRMMELLKSWAETEQTRDEKTMVVSQWTSLLDLTADYLDEHGFTYVRYQGDMSRTQRQQTIRTFMSNGKARVLLMSMKGGGVGLNLTRANHVISLDLGWSPAIEQQAFDRVHRLGQTRVVTIDQLVIQDTVEARILALQERKQDLMDGSLGEGKAAKLSRLSVRDLANLFGLRA